MIKSEMKPSKILIIRLSAAGDIILTFPACIFLIKNFPEAKIDWAVDERFSDLPGLVAGVNKKIIFPGKTLKNKNLSAAEKIKAAWNFIKEIRRENYDLVIDFQGLFKSGLISFLSGAKVRAALAPGGHDSREFNHWLNNKIIKIDSDNPISSKILYRSLNLAARAAGAVSPENFTMEKLVVPPAGRAEIGSFFETIRHKSKNGKIIALNPFTNWPTKTWPAEKWMELIREFRREDKLKNFAAVILWGPAEKETAEKIAASDELTFISPPTSLVEVFSVLERCDAVVSGDSFALHAAFVLNKPVAALFGASDPARCAPFGEKTVLATQKLECQHCFKRTCPLGSCDCIKNLQAVDVLKAILSLDIA